MDKEDISKKFGEKFAEMKKDVGFKSELEDIDKIFFIKDFILEKGFVSDNLSRQICSRIVDTYVGWGNYLHSLIFPNPQNLFNLGESKIFNEEEKKKITDIMKISMEISSRHSLIGLTKDKKREGKFIDDAVKIWNERFRKEIIYVMDKVNKEWKGETK